uniref:Uncharacterized protein n=1 Tax=Ananas comosus var. bracteatus TaxID=296719 RepID=A0A6V7NIZ4_ANACO|nr:unnamed protein product [Ananas comosus var. bracteatus]
MVALAVSRGNLHKVPNAPRRWPLPPRSISLPQFKNLLRRRALALSRIAAAAAAAADENPSGTSPCTEKKVKGEEAEESPEKAANPAIGGPAAKNGEDEPAPDGKAVKEDAADSKLEVIDDSKDIVKKEESKGELENKLQVLNEKKHNLVQMLKQILNAEEEVKRRTMLSSVPMPLHVEVNFGGDSAGESDAAPSHSSHGRQLHQIHSTSPSASSLNRPVFGSLQQNSNPSRGLGAHPSTTYAASNSPSGFPLMGQLAHAQAFLYHLPGPNLRLLLHHPLAQEVDHHSAGTLAPAPHEKKKEKRIGHVIQINDMLRLRVIRSRCF